MRWATSVTRAYVEDLTDAELLVRSVPGSNHIAWQLGHMIGSVRGMLAGLGRQAPALPDGFEAAYTPETSASDDPAKFATKAQYLSLMDQMKAASLAAVEATPESELDAPGPESMREYPDGRRRVDAVGHPLADARRPVRADPPQARQAAAVLRSWTWTSVLDEPKTDHPVLPRRKFCLRKDLRLRKTGLPSSGGNRYTTDPFVACS